MAKHTWNNDRGVLISSLMNKIESELSHDDKLYLVEHHLPRKFISKILQDFKGFISSGSWESLNHYLIHFCENLSQGKGIIFCGPIGTGKTAASTLILKYAYGFLKNSEFYHQYREQFIGQPNIDYMICFWPAVKVLMDYFDAKDLFEAKTNATILVIDDITKANQDIYKEIFDFVIRHREHSMLPTILTSQMPLKELKDYFGLAIQDIIAANCTEINLVGQSKRG